MTDAEIKALTGLEAMELFREYSEACFCAGWIGKPFTDAPFRPFRKWLKNRNRTFEPHELEFIAAWDKWRKA